MSILLIYDCVYPESLGGVEYRNHCLAQALAERGHRPTVAGWTRGPDRAENGVRILPLAFRSPIHDEVGQRSMLASLKFAAAVARIDVAAYDVIEAANIPYTHLLPLALRCFLARRPLFVTWYEFFGPYWRHYKGPLFAPLYRLVEYICAQFGRVNATSPLTAERLSRARLRDQTAGIQVIPCGVWLRDIQKASQQPAQHAPPLFYAGRLIAEKRIDLLLRALAKVSRDSPASDDVLLGIAGDGPDRVRLEALAAELGISTRVRFYGRLHDIAEMWRLLAGARLAVQPSAREGFGLFPLEALALGKPVVTCEAPDNAINAVVRPGIEGLCSAPNPDALAACLTQLLVDDTLWARMSKAATSRAALYDWPEIARRFEAFLGAGR